MNPRRRLLAAWLRLRRRLRRLRAKTPTRTTRRIFAVSLAGILVLFLGFAHFDQTPTVLIESKVQKLEDQGNLLVSQLHLFGLSQFPGTGGWDLPYGGELAPFFGELLLLEALPPFPSFDLDANGARGDEMRLPGDVELAILLAHLRTTIPLHVQVRDPAYRVVAEARHESILSDALPEAPPTQRQLSRIGGGIESVVLAPLAEALARLRARQANPSLHDGILYQRIDEAGPVAPPENFSALPFASLSIVAGEPMRLSVTLPIVRVQRIDGFLTVSEASGGIGEHLRRDNLRLLRIALMSLLVSLVLSGWLAYTIARPLEALATHARAIRQSGETRDLAESWPRSAGFRDEIGQLSEALAGLTRSLARRTEKAQLFADMVAHELRQPVYSINTVATTLREKEEQFRSGETDAEALAAKLESGLPTIINSARRMNTLVTDISAYAKLDPSLLRKPLAEFDACALACAVAEEMRPLAAERGATLETNLPPAPVSAVGAPQPMAQAVVNLVSNAVSFSPPDGTVTLGVEPSGRTVRVVVEDEGPGIPLKQREAVFEAMYSVRNEEDDLDSHSGLGLSVVRDIVTHAGGRVWVEDAPGQPGRAPGARLVVELRASLSDSLPPSMAGS